MIDTKVKDGLFEKPEETRFKKGSILLKPGEKIEKIYYLKHGNVRMYKKSPAGDVTIHIFKKGSFFPIALFIGKLMNKYYFQALTNIKVKISAPEKVVRFLKDEPEVLFDLTKRLSKGLEGMASRITENLGERVDKKLLSTIKYLSQSFGKEEKGFVRINLPLSHNDLASWLGISRETVSREMKKLAKSGQISYKYKQISLIKKN